MPVSGELFYLDKDGKRQDADLHAEMLDNPEAERKIALDIVLRKIGDGTFSEADALQLFGVPSTASDLAAYRKAAGGK